MMTRRRYGMTLMYIATVVTILLLMKVLGI